MSGQPLPGVGLGVDVHRFGGTGPISLGGVKVEYRQGLLGHSDGDVLAHAVADAVLGAAGLGDLGEHFPSADERWRGADSMDLLGQVAQLLLAARIEVLGVDATVVAEEPRLEPYRAAMVRALAAALGVESSCVSVKSKSSDGLGLTGRGEGMAGLAVARVARLQSDRE